METAALQVISAPTLSHMAATQRIIQEDNDDDAGYKEIRKYTNTQTQKYTNTYIQIHI